MIETYGTGVKSDDDLSKCVQSIFPCRPGQLIKHLDLLRPIYQQTAAYGHFGRDVEDFTWEKTDMVDKVQAYFA